MVKFAQKYLSFYVNKENYALNINRIREVLGYTTMYRNMENAERFMGMINLRGLDIPVIDLHSKFHTDSMSITNKSSIIIIEQVMANQILVYGFFVDSVEDVFDMLDDNLHPVPPSEGIEHPPCLKATGKLGERNIPILDEDHLLDDGELKVLTNPISTKPA